MSKRGVLWAVPLILYLAFVAWYTDFSGPLTEEEITAFSRSLQEQGVSQEQLARMRAFMEADTGRQFLMVNIIDMADDPPDVAGAEPGESAQELMARYMEYMYPALLARASHPVLAGTAVFANMDTVGVTGADDWTMAAMMRYRSRRALMEIASNPAFTGRHEFKTAALDKTIAYPIEMDFYYSDPRLVLGLFLLALTVVLDLLFLRRRVPA